MHTCKNSIREHTRSNSRKVEGNVFILKATQKQVCYLDLFKLWYNIQVHMHKISTVSKYVNVI